MDFFFQNRYYKLNRLLLRMMGLWPYESRLRRISKLGYVVTLLTGGLCGLIMQLVLEEITLAFFSGSIQLLVPGICVLINMLYLCYNSSKKHSFLQYLFRRVQLRMCVEHIRDDWSLHDESDIKIMKRFAEMSRFCTLVTTLLGVALSVVQVLQIPYPTTTVNTNKTESAALNTPQIFPLMNSPDYQIYAVAVYSISIVVSSMSIMCIACMFCCGSIHAYGMFYIAGLRFETIFDNYKEDAVCNKSSAFVEFFRAIFFHNRAIKMIGLVNSLFGTLYIADVGALIGVMSCDILVSYEDDFNLFITTSTNFCAVFMCTFVLSFIGQLLMDESTGIVAKIYASQWYMVPPNIQRLVITIMMRSQMECGIFMTRSLCASYDMFFAFVKIATSYYMTLRSLPSACPDCV